MSNEYAVPVPLPILLMHACCMCSGPAVPAVPAVPHCCTLCCHMPPSLHCCPTLPATPHNPNTAAQHPAPTTLPHPPRRYEYYLKLLAEVRAREEHDVRALQQGKRQREGATKVKVEAGGKVRLEVRLEAKKHRQVSRRRAKQGLQGSLGEEQGW
jgi:hypothetical protein